MLLDVNPLSKSQYNLCRVILLTTTASQTRSRLFLLYRQGELALSPIRFLFLSRTTFDARMDTERREVHAY